MADIRAAEATVREWERVGKLAREALTDARVEAADLQDRIDLALQLIEANTVDGLVMVNAEGLRAVLTGEVSRG